MMILCVSAAILLLASSASAFNVAVIGASGLTASECVFQALKEGDNVFGLSR
jgi:hypothetical protein